MRWVVGAGLVLVVAAYGCGPAAPGPASSGVVDPQEAPLADREPVAPPGPGVAEKRPTAPARPAIGYRITRHPALVRAEPSHRSKRRGKTEGRQPFAIYALVPGKDCAGEGWAEVDRGGYVCLEHATVGKSPPQIQPPLLEGKDVPFIYARPKVLDRKTEAIAVVPRYVDRQALARGDVLDHLQADRQYTFVRTKLRAEGLLLFDADDRVVAARDMKIAKESGFSGRDLALAPIPAGLAAAWSVSRPAPLRERAERSAAVLASVGYHRTLHIDPAPITVGEDTWFLVPDGGGPGIPAYVAAEDANYWLPGPPLAEVGADQVWIDVELGQQTAALMRGQSPTFITLMSSGAGGFATPRGLFRIYEKLAVWTMKSSPNSEDPYFVEGVPWIQYFHRRYAFHTSYWHDDFGKRRSHGCVNLAPKDAARFYAATTPEVPPGWNSMFEYPGYPGTLVRVRKGHEEVPDLRLPLGVIEEEEETGGAQAEP